MEALADILQPYKELVGAVAGIVTVGQMFSGSFLCYDIYRDKSTKSVGIMPFLGGLVLGILNLQYGMMLRDATMIRVNFIGIALSIIYLVIYFNYAPDKGTVWLKMGAGGAFAAALVGYTQVEDGSLVEHRFGLIITALMFLLIASPLFGLGDIIKNKSTEGMPFPMILSGTVVTFMWLLYGIILRNNFIVAQNIVGFGLSAVQLSLFAIYPSKPASKTNRPKTRKVD